MKRYIIVLCAAVMFAACAKDNSESLSNGPGEDEVAVKLQFGVPASSISTSTDIVPMATRDDDTEYKLKIRDIYIYVMKQVGDDFIVDQVVNMFDNYGAKGYKAGETNFDFNLILRPGNYNLVVLINGSSANRNGELVIGKKVYNVTEDRSTALPLVTYAILTKDYNMGYPDALSAMANVYVGIVENVLVEKSTDLSESPIPLDINIPIKNVMGKIRMLGKASGPDDGFGFWPGYFSSTVKVINKSSKDFVYGYNVLGEPYYRPDFEGTLLGEYPLAGKRELQLVIEMEGSTKLQTATNGLPYTVPRFGGRASGFFYFVDTEDTEGIDCVLTNVVINYVTSGYNLCWKDSPNGAFLEEPMNFGVKKINPIAFELLDYTWEEQVVTDKGPTTQRFRLIRKSLDENGVEEDAAALFGPYLECNI